MGRAAVAAAFAVQGLLFISLTTRLPRFQTRWDLSELFVSGLLLMVVLLAGAGFVADDERSGITWMNAQDRPDVAALRDQPFKLVAAVLRTDFLSHHPRRQILAREEHADVVAHLNGWRSKT